MALQANDPCEVFKDGAWSRATVKEVRENEDPPIFYACQFEGQTQATWYGEGNVRAVVAAPRARPSP
jgi:hypothetical protein